MGEIQGIARVDYLDLNETDDGVLGGKQTAYQLGLTWIPVDYVRFLLNYSRLELKDAAIAVNGDRDYGEIGRAHVCTPVTNAHLVCRLLLEKKNGKTSHNRTEHTPDSYRYSTRQPSNTIHTSHYQHSQLHILNR